ncbi:MAG TPA: RES family NAD+ phosphorylase [Caulobacteraceae bacterium]|nr:RES family NAD+ phosphorylase [Caulobacteraceae bacterium]
MPAFNTRVVRAGASLVRVHDPAFAPATFNPCRGRPTRFAPLQYSSSECLPSLYAASNFECAVFETLFHDLDVTDPDKFIPLQDVTTRAVSELTISADLKVATLHEPDLNLLKITRAELIDTHSSEYEMTARWAEAFHRADPELAGLQWTSKRCDPAQAFVFFEDRVPEGTFAVVDSKVIGASLAHFQEIQGFARRAGITITR